MKVIINGSLYREAVEYVRFGVDNHVRLCWEGLTKVESVRYTTLNLESKVGWQIQVGMGEVYYEAPKGE